MRTWDNTISAYTVPKRKLSFTTKFAALHTYITSIRTCLYTHRDFENEKSFDGYVPGEGGLDMGLETLGEVKTATRIELT